MPKRLNCFFIEAMLLSVHSRGGVLFFKAAFSAGRPNGVPTHWVQYVVTAHPHVPRQRVAYCVVPHMPHVQRTARVRQHLQAVVLRLAAVVALRGVNRWVGVP